MPGIFNDEYPKGWANPGKSRRDAAHFASGRHFERLEGGDPAVPHKASQKQNGQRQHHNLNLKRP